MRVRALTMAVAGALACLGGALAGAGSHEGPPSPAASSARAPRPDWVRAHMAGMVGTWIADNRRYRSEAEPYDAYRIEWEWGLGEQSLVGRLSALTGSREMGTLWEFREFWHPGEGRLLASQFGSDGTFGIGPHERKADGTMEMRQTFHEPSGATYRVGHRSEHRGGETTTRSFSVGEDGTWTDRRTYVWRRQPAR